MVAALRNIRSLANAGVLFLLIIAACRLVSAADTNDLAVSIRKLSPYVFEGDERDASRRAVANDLRARLQQANDESRRQWLEVKFPEQWQAFREDRLAALKKSLGSWPATPKQVRIVVASTVEGDGFVIENIAFESRPGWWVTANLYRPEKPTAAMPGIIISHSHHRPKEQGELQDMGMTWARAGCCVLVPDHLGHGERGQHDFTSGDDFPREFALSRQDYYFRYDNSIQLYLTGDSLMGWMAWDLMRGVDVLLAQEGIDKDKIVLLGAVAGGGDPCAVTAALDDRIACAAPFNFGGPQPETRYPLPEDAETSFNYAGGGSWESTRNLAFSASDGSRFLPWEIVGSIAPRRLIFGHEFSWHRERDPVWKRLEHVYELQDARDHLAFAHGRGELKGRPPEATHCTHIGKFHRVQIHEALAKWFDIQAEEYSNNVESARLRSQGAFGKENVESKLLCDLLADDADAALAKARSKLAGKSSQQRRKLLRATFNELLRSVEPPKIKKAQADGKANESYTTGEHSYRVIRHSAGSDRPVPFLLLVPDVDKNARVPVVIGLAQEGKEAFLKYRAEEIAKLLAAGVAVCLPDVTNTGELIGDNGRGRYSSATSRAATALMVGDPVIAQQLCDVQAVLHMLRTDELIRPARIAIWGESFSELNSADTNFRAPRRIDGRPRDVEPLGGMLALLAALFDDNIDTVYIHRGLSEFRGALNNPFVYVPLDSVIPGLLDHADLPDLAAAVSPRPLRLAGMVDATNRQLAEAEAKRIFDSARQLYELEDAADQLTIVTQDESPAAWLIQHLEGE